MDEFHRRPYVGHPGYQKNGNNSKVVVLLAKNEGIHCIIHFQVSGQALGRNS
jgi:hypothetical protein